MTSLVHVISSSSTDAKLGKDLEEAAAILSQLWSNLEVEKEKALVSKATNWMKMYTMPGLEELHPQRGGQNRNPKGNSVDP